MVKYFYFLPLFLLFSGCISFNVALFSAPGPVEEVQIKPGKTSSKVLILDIDGVITNSSKGGMLTSMESPVSLLKQRLNKAKQDVNLKAIVLRVNSPGGGVTASDIMYEELRRFREETGIPIVACFMDVVASGGYYISMSADKIVCHPTCITGSIGVIAQLATIGKLLEKVGVEPLAIKSGKHKDMASPFRKQTEEEKKIMQGLVDSMYGRFVDVVAKGRGIAREKVLKIADGRVYDAAQALELKLVDNIGYLEDAIAVAEQAAGIKHSKVVMYEAPGGHINNIYSSEAKTSESALDKLADGLLPGLGAGLYYLWIPGR